MKIAILFLSLVCCAFSSNPIEKIYTEAFDLCENNFSEKSTEEVLYEFYSEKIANLDIETLKSNPELFFRRALAHFEVTMSIDSLPETLERFTQIQNDLQFVLNHANRQSKLFKASQLRLNFIEKMLAAAPQTIDDFLVVALEDCDTTLRQWATNPLATGKDLRDDVFYNLSTNPTMLDSFFQIALLSDEDPDLALGYIAPDQLELIGVEEDEDGAVLLYRIKYYRTPYYSVSITVGL